MSQKRPLVDVRSLGHDAFDKRYYHEFFQSHFLYHYIMGPVERYFASDYTTEGLYVQQDKIVQKIWMRACSVFDLDPRCHVGRCYLNGQTAGLDGPWHEDSDDGDHIYTMVYYPVMNKGGKHLGTEFRLPDGTTHLTDYIQDTAVLFRGDLTHRGLSTTAVDSLRISLVFHGINPNQINQFMFDGTCGNDERLDKVIGPIIP